MAHLFIASYLAGVKDRINDFLKEKEKETAHLLFIPTAGNVETYTEYINEGMAALNSLGYRLDCLDIANENAEDSLKKIETAQGIVVTGGNTFYLLQELKSKQLLSAITCKIVSGCPYIGESAGGIILAPSIAYVETMDDVTQAPELTTFDGLNVIDFYPLPHQGEEPFKEVVETIYRNYQARLPLLPINNQQAIIVEGADRVIVHN